MNPDLYRQINTAFELEFGSSKRDIAAESRRAVEGAPSSANNPAFAPSLFAKEIVPRFENKTKALTVRIKNIFDSFDAYPSDVEYLELLARYKKAVGSEASDWLAALNYLKTNEVKNLIDHTPQEVQQSSKTQEQDFELMLTLLRSRGKKQKLSDPIIRVEGQQVIIGSHNVQTTHVGDVLAPEKPLPDRKTRLDLVTDWLKNRQVIVGIAIASILITWLANQIDSIGKIRSALWPEKKEIPVIIESTAKPEASRLPYSLEKTTSVPSGAVQTPVTQIENVSANNAWESAQQFNNDVETRMIALRGIKLRAALQALEDTYEKVRARHLNAFGTAATGFKIDPRVAHIEYELGLVRTGFNQPKSFCTYIVEIHEGNFSFQVEYDGKVREFYVTSVAAPDYGPRFEEAVKGSMAYQLEAEMARQD